MNTEIMENCIETERLILFPYTAENLALFNRDLPLFEQTFGVVYRGEELDHLLTEFLTDTLILLRAFQSTGTVSTGAL